VNWSRILVTSATHELSAHNSRLPPTPTTRMRGGPSKSAHFVAFVGLMVSPQTNAVIQMKIEPPMNHGAPPASSDRSSSHEVPKETMAASAVRRLAATRRFIGEYSVHRDRSPARVAKASTRLKTLTPWRSLPATACKQVATQSDEDRIEAETEHKPPWPVCVRPVAVPGSHDVPDEPRQCREEG